MKLTKMAFSLLLCTGLAQVEASAEPIFPASITADSAQSPSDHTKDQAISDKVVVLPVSGILATEKGGKIVLVTTNGRYTIVGDITDTWSQKKLTSIAAMRESANKIPIKDMKLNLEELDPIVIGEGPRNIIIFTDPYCGYCKNLIEQAKGLDPKEFKVQIMALAMLGKESEQRVADIYCAEDKRKANALFLAGDNKTPIKRASGACDGEAFMKRNVSAQLFGVNAVPFVIADDGRYMRGLPKQSLEDFLNN